MTLKVWPPQKATPIADTHGVTTAYYYNWLNTLYGDLNTTLGQGFTGTITTAKLTGGGANGSITFTNGVVTGQTAAT